MAKATASTSPAEKPGEGQGAGIAAGTTGGEAGTPGAGEGTSGSQVGGDEEGGPDMVHPILVRSVPAKGRWRIGMHFTQEPILLDAAELDDDQKALLAGDPELIIQTVD